MDITKEQIKSMSENWPPARLLALSRAEVLALSAEEKMYYLYSFQAKHEKLEIVTHDVMRLLSRYNETNIIPIIGGTGIGKTSFAKMLLRQLVEKMKFFYSVPSNIPFMFVAAPANGDKSLSWMTMYEKALRAANEILIEKKQSNIIKDGIFTVKPRRFKTLAALREALESMLNNRDVRVLVIDEAYHLLRFGNYAAVMDTLKSIVDLTNTKLILLGTYDLFNLVSNYGQAARRTEILHFQRYHIDNKADVTEFKTAIIVKIQENWPCEIVPAFDAISDELMEASLGCIGLLKSILLHALSMQLENKGKWNPKFMAKAAKSMKLLDVIRGEFEKGEKDIAGATYGDTLFSDQILEDIVKKMNKVTV